MSRLLLLALLVTEPAPKANPLATYALSRPEQFVGRVTERIPAGTYLYLRVQHASELHWVATLRRTAPAADEVRVTVFARAERFTSSRLAREFSPLSFGAVSPAAEESP